MPNRTRTNAHARPTVQTLAQRLENTNHELFANRDMLARDIDQTRRALFAIAEKLGIDPQQFIMEHFV